MWAEIDNPVNWVANKGQCTARAVLDVFMAHIKEDVEEMNSLPLSRRQNCKFEVTQDSCDGTITVKKLVENPTGHDCVGMQKGKTMFELNHEQNKINVLYGKDKTFTIKLTWNSEKAECLFTVQEKQRIFSLWKISQMALYELFFNEPYPAKTGAKSGSYGMR